MKPPQGAQKKENKRRELKTYRYPAAFFVLPVRLLKLAAPAEPEEKRFRKATLPEPLLVWPPRPA